MRLMLVVIDGKKILEASELALGEKLWKVIIPKRRPDRAKGKERVWIIPKDKRRVFGNHANKVLEKFGDNRDELFGFFALVGMGTRWADNDAVRWCLYLGDRELETGMNL